MKKSIIISILLAALLSSCASLTVTSDYDRQVDFTKYKTFSFAPESANLPVNELNKRRILDAIETQLYAKGLTKSEAGALLVDVRVSAKERRESTAYTTGGYGGYRYGGGFQTTSISTQTYLDGTLIISLVDAAKKELVWQGTGVKTIDQKATSEQREKNIGDAVKGILAKYPPVAATK
jgi:hypothetical protein